MVSHPRRLRFKATLAESTPPIWRTIDIDSDAGLDVLHQVLQIAFGWLDYHLHEFTTADPWRRARSGDPEPRTYGRVEDEDDRFGAAPDVADERRIRVGRFLSTTTSPVFSRYDFGDDWLVRLEFVESRHADPGQAQARIVKAKLRGPTEDSGGIGGWEDKRRAAQDPDDEEHEDVVDWLQAVDPQRYPITDVVDLDALNEDLQQVCSAAG